MLLGAIKSLWYYLPFKQYPVFHRLRMGLYHRVMRVLMRRTYGKIVVKDIHGIRYELDLSETIEASLYYSGVYEIETLKCLQRHIRPDMNVFEIGANIGSHSFEIAKCLQAGTGTLYCFEPTDYAFRKLMKNHALNHFTNIVFEQMALSDRNETRRITPASSLDTVAFSASWDVKNLKSKRHDAQDIAFKTLDAYVQEKQLAHVDLLKIDVDGYELKVMTGGAETLARFHPMLIIELSECLLHYIGDRLEDLLNLLERFGYAFQPVYMAAPINRERLLDEIKLRQTLDCLCVCQSPPAPIS